jgi:hypothetical protein
MESACIMKRSEHTMIVKMGRFYLSISSMSLPVTTCVVLCGSNVERGDNGVQMLNNMEHTADLDGMVSFNWDTQHRRDTELFSSFIPSCFPLRMFPLGMISIVMHYLTLFGSVIWVLLTIYLR